MLDQSSQKNEMETNDENRIFIGRKIQYESGWIVSELSMIYKIYRAVRNHEKDGKMKSMTSSDQTELKIR